MTAFAELSDVYKRPGPFVTVYLDASRDTESGAHEIDVRWRDVREQLESEQADAQSLDAVAAAIDADRSSAGRHGLIIVAEGGGVCLSDRLAQPPARSIGIVSPLPRLLPYLAQQASDVPHLVVVADRTGADILTGGTADVPAPTTVTGTDQFPVHRTGRDDWSEKHFQQRVENTWNANARDVAAAVDRLVSSSGIRLVIVAGDVRARALIVDDLGGAVAQRATIRSIEEGGRAAGSSDAALDRAVRDEVLAQVWRERREVLEHLAQNLGRHEYAVAGVRRVTEALRMHEVDTVVLSDDPSSTLTAWVGAQPTEFGLDDEEAAAFGLTDVQHDRYDAALVRAVVGSGAKLVITPGAHDYLPDGIGALLRYQAG